jgi:hypothetical protein
VIATCAISLAPQSKLDWRILSQIAAAGKGVVFRRPCFHVQLAIKQFSSKGAPLDWMAAAPLRRAAIKMDRRNKPPAPRVCSSNLETFDLKQTGFER